MGDKSAFVGGMKLKISELGKVITGNTPSKKIKEFWDKDDVGFVKPDIISDEHIVKIKSEDCNEFISNAAISKARIVPKNSIFVTCIGNIGKIGVATENLAFNQQINAIIPNENVNLDYLCYAIFANKTRLQDIANAPIVPLLNKSQFSEFELEFDMDINTQTRIVHELNTVSNIILKYKQELLLLDELVRARFVEMFGTIRENSHNYPRVTLKEVCHKITDGKHGGCKQEDNSGYYYVGAREIYDGKIHYDTAPQITYDDFSKDYRRCNLEKGDMVIVNTGATIGKSAIASSHLTEKTLLQKSVALIKVNSDIIIAEFLRYCYMVNPSMYMVKSASAQPNLLLSKMNSTIVYLPPIDLQRQFASFVEEIDKSRSRIQKSLEASQELFDSLMQEYFG
uniref:restriction endonuclease subunit S n=1 Tax=Catenibacterium mitsuokai TaxID=100886 RepID=UPI003D76ED64